MASPAKRDARRLLSQRRLRPWSVTTWLVVVCAAIFFVDSFLLSRGIGWTETAIVPVTTEDGSVITDASGNVLVQQSSYKQPPMRGIGAFSMATLWQIWRPISYQFLHGGLGHLAFNMIGLWVFGGMVERAMGRGRYLMFYLLSGVGGAVAFLLLYMIGVLDLSPQSQLVGASAGLFGLIIFAGLKFGDRELQLIFGPVPVRAVAIIYFVVALYGVFVYPEIAGRAGNSGGEAAHLGGALVGFLLWKFPALLDRAEAIIPDRFRKHRHRPAVVKDVKAPGYMKYHGPRGPEN